MDHVDRIPDHRLFRLPRGLIRLGMALIVVAGTTAFSFTATLARVAGVPEPLAWLYPVTGGLVIAVIAYSWVALSRSPYKRVAAMAWPYLGLLVVFFGGSVAGNVFVITRPPTPMDTLEIVMIVWLPPLCVLGCLFNHALLATMPARARSSIREDGLRSQAAFIGTIKKPPSTPTPGDQEEEQPWWNRYGSTDDPESVAGAPAPDTGAQPEPGEPGTAPRVQP
ncbi:hypothetical protein [Nocardia jinanensis]|uniref:DUF2637 domain-containing protein n=1 Tax=Nocardia jinanensis TaxID=382504 RepID=A0A917VZX1_9NOCA|nr:hypothetical protein [Nocardia jinanensis]GGL44352.1 hypothetical protein GCM10011588_68860 [Nocardia jinanensis]